MNDAPLAPNLTERAAAERKARQAREGEALRANLRRRKAQARARASGPEPEPGPVPDGSADLPDSQEVG